MLQRSLAVPLVALLLLLPVADAGASAKEVLVRAGSWLRGALASLERDEPVDREGGEIRRAELEAEVGVKVRQIREARGPERAVLVQGLAVVRQQLVLVDRALSPEARQAIDELRRGQDRLDARVDDLERRMQEVEGRVGELEERMTQVEEALIVQCTDLRRAPYFGAEGYRVQESGGRTHLVDDFDSAALTLALDGYLDSCTPELTERGLLLQVSLLTRDLERDLTLYATFKSAGAHGVAELVRLEYPLSRPGYRLDGQVAEIFVPYAEIPFPQRSDRLALALVLLHEGRVVYTLPDQVISCVFAQRTQCRWGR